MEPLPVGAYDSFDWTHPDHFYSTSGSYGSGSDAGLGYRTMVVRFEATFSGLEYDDWWWMGREYVDAMAAFIGTAPTCLRSPLTCPRCDLPLHLHWRVGEGRGPKILVHVSCQSYWETCGSTAAWYTAPLVQPKARSW